MTVRAVVFDLDGVLIDSEEIWERARRTFVAAHGGTYTEQATREIMGMSAPEWSHYLATKLGVNLPDREIDDGVVALVEAEYRRALPLFPGAVEVVRRLAARVPLGLASSSNRSLIDLVLELADIADCFTATVSAEEVGRGKPAPDVYLQAADRIATPAGDCAAIEDSGNGILSAKAAGMYVVALPNRKFPPTPEALGRADVIVDRLAALDTALFGVR
jgi:HAD superfamily hydrolase (TIGR01509 family)